MTRSRPSYFASRRGSRKRLTGCTVAAVAVVATSLVVDLVVSTPVASSAPLCASPPFTGSTTVSGVVNTYYPGATPTVTAGQATTTITVGSPTGAATPLAVGDLVVVMQMQGAEVDLTNSSAYGDGVGAEPATGYLTNANFAAGRYEYATVRSVLGSVIGVSGAGTNGGLLNGYRDVDATSTIGRFRYQVIRVPQFFGAVLSAATPPTAPAWNGATGGVVVLDAASTLGLNGATINVTGLGFKGGAQQ